MKIYVLEIAPQTNGLDEDTSRAGAFLMKHIMENLLLSDDLSALPLNDRVGAMILLSIAMNWILKSQSPTASYAFDVAEELYGNIGASTPLTPVGSTAELLQQLETRESK